MKKIIILVITLLCLNVSFASTEVDVQIPSFKTILNGVEFDNEKAKYPLIVYKDITYFPMTYELSRELGIITSWDENKGLYIAKYEMDFETHQRDMTGNNKKGVNYKAVIPDYPITINGAKIDNSKEEYPILNFRYITYFPMTWRFANDEFNWDISWDQEKGLEVANLGNTFSTQLVEVGDDSAIISRYVENGTLIYSLDYETNKLTLINSDASDLYNNHGNQEDITDLTKVENGKLFYNDIEIADFTDIAELKNNYKIYTKRFNLENANVLSVTVYNDLSIPAPYTPHLYFAFIEKNGVVTMVSEWEPNRELTEVYKIGETYYLCADSKYLGGRWNIGKGQIMKLEEDGIAKVLEYENYNSLRAIGTYEDKLYVLATWYPDENSQSYYGKVSAINDGFFIINTDGTMEKVYDFIHGNAFLAPNGSVYFLPAWKPAVIDLTRNEEILFP